MNYTVLFKGVNVGGKNIVKMPDLKQFLTDIGLNNVSTYIQSGNAVFTTNLESSSLSEKINAGFMDRFYFSSSVTIRNQTEMNSLIQNLPFTSAEISEAETADPQVEHLYIYFLNSPPEQKQIDAVFKKYTGEDKLYAGGKELYLLCRQSIRKSKLAISLSKLFDSSTVRNWNTVKKLSDMMANL